MVTIGIASIAHWKIAGLMSWEAIAAGVVPTPISSLRRHKLKAQKSMALSRNRQSPKAEFVVPALVAATGLYDPELESEVGGIDGEAYRSTIASAGRCSGKSADRRR